MKLAARALPLVLVGASGVLFAAYAQMTLPWAALGFVVVVPFLAAVDRARSAWSALGIAAAFSVAWVLAAFSWFPPAMAAYAGAPPALAWIFVSAAAPLIEPELLAAALARWHGTRRLGATRGAVFAGLVWVATERLWPKLFGDTLGHGLYPFSSLRQLAELGGGAGLTLLLLAANELVLGAVRALAQPRPLRRVRAAAVRMAVLAAVLAGAWGYGRARWAALEDSGGSPVAVGLVQANIASYEDRAAEAGSFAVVRHVLETHWALSDEILRERPVDLLVWAETVYPTTYGTPRTEEGAAFDRAIAAWVAERRVPLLFGTYEADGSGEYNAAVLLQPLDGRRVELASYRKAELFPFTERLPALLDTPALRRLLPWTGRWSPGESAATLDLSTGGRELRLLPLICYDALAPSPALSAAGDGAELIVTISNDAWFASAAAARLHLAIAAFRSIETRLPQVRATTTGISAVIDARGEIVTQSRHDEQAVIAATVRPAPASGLLVVLGDWVGIVAAIAALAMVVARQAARLLEPARKRDALPSIR